MLMLLFPYDAHLLSLVVAGVWAVVHWRHRRNATVRRLERLAWLDRHGSIRALAILSVLALGAGACGSGTDPTPIRVAPTFTKAGSGDAVFDLPDYVTRVTITGSFPAASGNCGNFIVWNTTHLLVNEIMGTCDNATTGRSYTGVLATGPGEVRIEQSTGVAWTFTEVR